MFDNPESPHKTFIQFTQNDKQVSTNYNHQMKSLTDIQISKFDVDLPIAKMKQQQKLLSDKHTQKVTSSSASNKLSLTESQLQARALIKFIMQRNKKKIIHHKIGEINKQTQLYAKPQKNTIKNEFIEKQAKIKYQKNRSIHKRFVSESSATTTISEQASENLNNIYKNERKKMITVSGLVSYKFNSIRAARNLGFDFKTDQQKLSQKLLKIKQKVKCAPKRGESIKNKSFSTNKEVKKQQNSFNKSFANHFSGGKLNKSTNMFLSQIQKDQKQSSYIYGQEYKKIASINEVMKTQHVDRQLAQFQIQQVIRSYAKPPVIKLRRKPRVIDQEKELLQRKKQYQKTRVILNNLTFVNDN